MPDSEKFARLGYNTGNMLFWQSLKANLPLEVIPRSYADTESGLDLGRYKAFITTDLIWIRQMQDLSYLNRTLDAIGGLPLVPISIGLQCGDMIPDFKLHPETVNVIKRISERCVMGVRGNYTAEILKSYGIDNFMVIGCPSMYMNAPGLRWVNNYAKPINKAAFNAETFYGKLDKQRLALLNYGLDNDMSFIEQTPFELSEDNIDDPSLTEKLQQLNLSRKCFFSVDEWREYVRQMDFIMGGRFHGNVIGLWEGVPALFITSDSRTKELCSFFSLPQLDISEFDSSKPKEYYYEIADYSSFHSNYSKLYINWNNFILRSLKGE